MEQDYSYLTKLHFCENFVVQMTQSNVVEVWSFTIDYDDVFLVFLPLPVFLRMRLHLFLCKIGDDLLSKLVRDVTWREMKGDFNLEV